MTFEVEANGHLRSVTVEPAGDAPGRLRVTIDGRARVFDVTRAGEHGLLIVDAADQPDGRTPRARDVQITPGAHAGDVLVHLHGLTIGASVNARRTGHMAEAGTHAHGEQSVVAPMPGRVVRVLVTPGQEVQARQGVVVVEAMKMENELRAPKAGRVKEVCVGPGTSVEAGRTLVVVE